MREICRRWKYTNFLSVYFKTIDWDTWKWKFRFVMLTFLLSTLDLYAWHFLFFETWLFRTNRTTYRCFETWKIDIASDYSNHPSFCYNRRAVEDCRILSKKKGLARPSELESVPKSEIGGLPSSSLFLVLWRLRLCRLII